MRRSFLGAIAVKKSKMFCLSICIAVSSLGTLRAADSSSDAWIGTWAASPQPFLPGALLTLRDQSVRLIAHTSIGGDSLRLRLSNTYAEKSLTLGPVRVALRAQGADIQENTAKRVTFAGHTSVTIPAGATTTSDPVPFKVALSADLVVTLYFLKNYAATTSHLLAQQSGYIASDLGDQTAAVQFKVGKTIHSWPFLTGIDVHNNQALGSLVVFGDSTVDGDGSTSDANHRWPDEIARMLNGGSGKDIAVLNAGIVGNRLLRASPSQPPSEFGNALGEAGIARFERDALSSSMTQWVIVRLGVNDIGMPGSLTPASEAVTTADLISGYKTLIDKAHQHHVKIYLATLTPFEGADVGAGYYSPEKESIRRDVNAWIRTGAGFDGVIDIDSKLKDPQHPSRLLSTFDSGDHLHPNDAANATSAATVTRQFLGVQ